MTVKRPEKLPLSTRDRILEAAVECLIESGVSGTTTLAVQHRSGVSRGALLHHFPSHAVLLAAAVAAIVLRNEQAAKDAFDCRGDSDDPLGAAVAALAFAARQPAYLAELELWSVSRTDKALRGALIAAERSSRRDHERVYSRLFANWSESESFEDISLLTQTFINGLALSENLRSSPKNREKLISAWSRTIKVMLESNPGKRHTKP